MMAIPATFVELCDAQQDKKISNVVGVVIDALPPTVSRKGDHMITFTLDDATLQYGLKCRLFAKKAEDLPPINGVGDILILRKVRFAYTGGQALLSNVYSDLAPWAIFHAPIPKDLGLYKAGIKHARSKGAQMTTEQEMEYVISLGKTQDRNKFTVLTEAVKQKLSTQSKLNPCLIRDLVLDSYSQIVGEVVKVFYNRDRASLYITDYTENNFLYDFGSRKKDDPADEDMRQWPGPPGKYTLMIECWSPHSDWIRENVVTGNFLSIKNVHIKANKDKQGLIDGLLHTDKIHPERTYASKLQASDVAALLLRKEKLGWGNGFAVQEEEEESNRKGKKRKSEEPQEQSKSQKRKIRDKENREHKKREALELVATTTSTENGLPSATPQMEIREAVNCINDAVRCEKGDYRDRTVSEIRDTSQTHRVELPNGQVTVMDYLEITSYATVRVIDFKPSSIEAFAKAVEISQEEQHAAEPESSSTLKDPGSDNESDHSDTSLHNKSTQVRKRKWEWKFALLLEDASPTSSSSPPEKGIEDNQLIVYIAGPDAEYLLGMKALDLRANPRTLAHLKEKLFLMWGDLEEFKRDEARRKQERQSRVLGEVSNNSTSSSGSATSSQAARPTSRPFRCLIEEYGEEIQGRWQRKFRMKATTIVQGSSPKKEAISRSHGLQSWDDIDDETTEEAQPEIQPLRAPRAG